MRVSETVILCGKMAQLGLEADFDSQSVATNASVQNLITCCNNVLQELYCEYVPVVDKCQVESVDNFIDTSHLDLCRVISLTGNGGKVAYRYSNNGLIADNGKFTLVYAKKPQAVGWNDDIVLPSCISERVFAYGVLAEYFVVTGDFSTANVWERKYQDALHAALIKTPSQNMPSRRWL